MLFSVTSLFKMDGETHGPVFPVGQAARSFTEKVKVKVPLRNRIVAREVEVKE